MNATNFSKTGIEFNTPPLFHKIEEEIEYNEF